MDGIELTVLIDAIGLPDFQKYLDLAPGIATQAARLSINSTAERKGLKAARDAMLQQVAFPSGYLTEPARGSGMSRFRISYSATSTNLEAAIVGEESPTPLARFSPARPSFTRGKRPARGRGIPVMVKPGHMRTLDRAFLINLRSGNIGLGIRLHPGEVLANTVGAKIITSGPLRGVALLYGPSVEQVFRTVAVDISPVVLEELQTEFLRQYERLSRDG